jgi:tRNA (guanine6-N2)-methyltransferase
LEKIARRELREQFQHRVEFVDTRVSPGVLRFSYVGNLYQLLKLQTIQAVYLVRGYPIPRPKAFLGDQHFKALLAQIAAVRDLSPKEAYQTLYISAAGSESSVMIRLRDELAAKTGLQASSEEGDLLIRLRHPPGDSESWEALVRLSPRPLATRPWRVCNWEGALNATVAHAMAFLTQPKPDDVYLNLACGSGTLLVERLAQETVQNAIGYDTDELALECARRNIEAAGFAEQIKLRQGDIRSLPMPDKSVDAICADLPFGHLVGSHDDNVTLYPEVLREAGRVLKPGGCCVILSHEVRLMESLLDGAGLWDTEQIIRVAQGGLYPRIFVLRRR